MYTKDIHNKARQTEENLTQTAHKLKDRSEELFEDSWKNLQAKSSDIQENIVQYITANPFKSLGIAAITGILLAHLLRK